MKNKILFVSRTLTGGGAERFIANLANKLSESGYKITILLYEKHSSDYFLNKDIDVRQMPNAKNNKIGKLSRIISMRKKIKEIDPDIIIPFIDTVMACAFISNIGIKNKFIYTVRNSPWDEEESKTTKYIKNIIINYADYIMVQNKEQIEYFKDKYSDKMVVIPNPVGEKFLKAKKEKYSDKIKNIIFVGRLQKQKNIHFLLKAFNKLIKENNDLILRIYGEGSDYEILKKEIFKLNIDKNCILCGRSKNIENELIKADLYVLTSDYEGMPNSLIEAMAIGLPCISSDCRTGPKSLINPFENGILFETGNEIDFIKKINWAIKNPKVMELYGMNARKTIQENFTLEIVEKKFITAFLLEK